MQTARALSAAIGAVAGYNGYHPLMTWDAASNALAPAFDLTPEQVAIFWAPASNASSSKT